MELKEIRQIVTDIIITIENNKFGYTYRGFDTFVTGAGKKTPRNVELLKKFDYQFKKHFLSLHCGREQRKSIFDFSKDETVTFRKNGHEINETVEKIYTKRISFKHAGTIELQMKKAALHFTNIRKRQLKSCKPK